MIPSERGCSRIAAETANVDPGRLLNAAFLVECHKDRLSMAISVSLSAAQFDPDLAASGQPGDVALAGRRRFPVERAQCRLNRQGYEWLKAAMVLVRPYLPGGAWSSQIRIPDDLLSVDFRDHEELCGIPPTRAGLKQKYAHRGSVALPLTAADRGEES